MIQIIASLPLCVRTQSCDFALIVKFPRESEVKVLTHINAPVNMPPGA
jgi:hypothetical protein